MNEFSGSDLSSFRGGRLVIQDLGFSVAAGKALVLTGPNGSGKSTLLRLMAGLLDPLTGQLAWNGEPIADDMEGHRGRTAYLGHSDAIKPVLTVREDLDFWRKLSGASADIDHAITAMGLEAQAKLPGRYLSSGQRRRTALARVLISGAVLWLLDEPSVGLDAASTARLASEISAHLAGGGMVVAATHVDLGLGSPDTLDVGDYAVDPLQPLEI